MISNSQPMTKNRSADAGRPDASAPLAETKVSVLPEVRRKRMLRLLSIAVFLVFFQGYMVAPLLPHLSRRLAP